MLSLDIKKFIMNFVRQVHHFLLQLQVLIDTFNNLNNRANTFYSVILRRIAKVLI